jgi:hypothetical protein
MYEETYRVIEARASLYEFLDAMLLTVIDECVFLSLEAEEEVYDVGYDVSTYGSVKEPYELVMFTDAIQLDEIFEMPTGDTHKTYESGSGMAATTHGDRILEAAEDWCYVWYEEYTKDLLDDPDLLSEEFGEAGLTMPWDWFNQLNGTLGELRSRCEQLDEQ